jgi:hypothetical protein
MEILDAETGKFFKKLPCKFYGHVSAFLQAPQLIHIFFARAGGIARN